MENDVTYVEIYKCGLWSLSKIVPSGPSGTSITSVPEISHHKTSHNPKMNFAPKVSRPKSRRGTISEMPGLRIKPPIENKDEEMSRIRKVLSEISD